MRKLLSFQSIRDHIIVYFLIIFLLSIGLLGIAGYSFFSEILVTEIMNYSARIVDEARLNIDSYFHQLQVLLQITASNELIIGELKNYNPRDYTKILYFDRNFNSVLVDIIKFNYNIKEFIVIGKDGKALYTYGPGIKTDYNFYQQPWFAFSSQYSKVTFIGVHPQDYYINSFEEKSAIISAVIPVQEFMLPNQENYGLILCNLSAKKMQEITKEILLEKSGFIIIMDENKRMIYQPPQYRMTIDLQRKLVQKSNQAEKGYFILGRGLHKMVVVYSTSKVTRWKVVALIPMAEIMGHLNVIRVFALGLIAVCILLVVTASVIISRKITKPIVRLMQQMECIEQGNFNIKLYDNSNEEIEKLSSRIDLMIERINMLNRDIYSYQINSKDAKIKALQAQINPHFLFNTLQSIKAMAVCGRNDEISRMVTLIGNILRYAVYDAEELVEIGNEINHVTEYLEIQSYRYPRRFDYKINCSPDLEKLRTLKLILQPIVENAILHGLRQQKRGLIQITVTRIEDQVQLEIFDNGRGMNETEIEKITEHLEDPAQKDNSSSIGLKNVHERIRLKFGSPYGVKVFAEQNKGTRVRVVIPIIADQREAPDV